MFDYAQRLQLALKDMARRSVLKAVAGVILAVAAGFLIAALWSFLAHDLGWGSALASLAVGAVFVVVAIALLAASGREAHPMPTKDDLRREVEARVTLAKEAAIDRARAEAERVVDMAGNKAAHLMDEASYRANKLAADTERRVYGAARHAAETVGLTSRNLGAMRSRMDDAGEALTRAGSSNAASMAKILGAFAVGITLAAKLRERSRPDDSDDFL